MEKFSVCAVYSHSPDGRTALKFAADLLRHLHGERLYVYCPGGTANQVALASTITSHPEKIQALNLLADVQNQTGLPAANIEIRTLDAASGFPPDAILVDHNGRAVDVNTLVPFDESALNFRSGGPILIPFGTDESSIRAASIGFPLARLLGCEIVFYHTTWRNRAVSLPEPAAHMCAKAKAVGERLRAAATAGGIAHRTIVETAQDVVLGTLRCAVRERANLIVMSREPKIVYGSYVDRTMQQSVVPMLIVVTQPKETKDSGAKVAEEASGALIYPKEVQP